MVNDIDDSEIWITGGQLAKICGVSDMAISRAKRNGRIISINDKGKFHRTKAAEEFEANRKTADMNKAGGVDLESGLDLSKPPDAETLKTLDKTITDFEQGKAPPENGKFTYTAARAIREAIIAKEAWIKLQKIEGTIISKTAAIAQVQIIAKHNRDSWLNWPQSVAIEMAEQLGVDSGVLHSLLLKEVKAHLENVATMEIKLPGADEPAPLAPAEEAESESLAFDFSEDNLDFEDADGTD